MRRLIMPRGRRRRWDFILLRDVVMEGHATLARRSMVKVIIVQTPARISQQSIWNSEKWRSPPSCLTRASLRINLVYEIDLLKQIETSDLKRKCRPVLFQLRVILAKLAGRMRWAWTFKPLKLKERASTDRPATLIPTSTSIRMFKPIKTSLARGHQSNKHEVSKLRRCRTFARRTGQRVSYSEGPWRKKPSGEDWNTPAKSKKATTKASQTREMNMNMSTNPHISLHTSSRTWRRTRKIRIQTFIRSEMLSRNWHFWRISIQREKSKWWQKVKFCLPKSFLRTKIMIIGKISIWLKTYISTPNIQFERLPDKWLTSKIIKFSES